MSQDNINNPQDLLEFLQITPNTDHRNRDATRAWLDRFTDQLRGVNKHLDPALWLTVTNGAVRVSATYRWKGDRAGRIPILRGIETFTYRFPFSGADLDDLGNELVQELWEIVDNAE